MHACNSSIEVPGYADHNPSNVSRELISCCYFVNFQAIKLRQF
jgi:hypothetical protein